MIKAAACVHFISNGNHRAEGVLDNCEDVVFRKLAIKMHTPVREQTDMGVYWCLTEWWNQSLERDLLQYSCVEKRVRKSVSLFKALMALGWDRRCFQVPEAAWMPSVAVLPNTVTENKHKQIIACYCNWHMRERSSCCYLCVSHSSPSLPKNFEYFPSLAFPKFVVCQCSWFYFIKEFDSNND